MTSHLLFCVILVFLSLYFYSSGLGSSITVVVVLYVAYIIGESVRDPSMMRSNEILSPIMREKTMESIRQLYSAAMDTRNYKDIR